MITDNLDEFKLLGVEEHTLGSHSCRKGAITLVSTGCTASPSMASICLRAGWSMGNVKDRYIHYEKSGDQYCGRSVTGISSMTRKFAVSPVYWYFTESGERGKKGVKDIIQEKFLNQNEVEPHVFEILRYLFAALCYHCDFLDKTLAKESKLRASPLYNACANFEFRNVAKIAYPWSGTKYTPQPSGIPPHTMLLVEMEKMKHLIEEQADMIVTSVKEELDKRHVGGIEYRVKEILEEVITIVS